VFLKPTGTEQRRTTIVINRSSFGE